MKKKDCEHQLIADKVKPFAYCEKCLMCFKDGKWITVEEYKEKYLSQEVTEGSNKHK